MKDVMILNSRDTVAVACRDLQTGETIETGSGRLTLTEAVPKGHKLALQRIPQGSPVIKYGYPIGAAAAGIEAGSWVHTHNLKTLLSETGSYRYQKQLSEQKTAAPETFPGYRRENGDVGIRNEIWIIPTVGCINQTAETLARLCGDCAGPEVDGVFALTHPYGCSQIGDDFTHTGQLLADLCRHPNAGGVLLLGLGCENTQLSGVLEQIPQDRRCRIRTLICQEVEDELEAGEALIRELAEQCGRDRREAVSVGELVIGLKCGGSDAFSGITANPLVGAFSDLLVSRGGTSVLTEVPEMFGAETPLLSRCQSEAVFEAGVDMIDGFKRYYADNHQPVYENPSPGNKAGGITTLEEKSLGCTQKAGTGAITDVLDYGQRIRKPGVVLLKGPGNDLVATTALAAAGAHAVLFTTGRGTPFSGVVPTVKISSNTDLYRRKGNWIDFDAGQVLEQTGMEELAGQLYRYVLELAGGARQTKGEARGFRELAIFKTGVTL